MVRRAEMISRYRRSRLPAMCSYPASLMGVWIGSVSMNQDTILGPGSRLRVIQGQSALVGPIAGSVSAYQIHIIGPENSAY